MQESKLATAETGAQGVVEDTPWWLAAYPPGRNRLQTLRRHLGWVFLRQ